VWLRFFDMLRVSASSNVQKNRVVQATLSVNLGEAENPSSEGAMAKRKGSEAEMFCKNLKNR